MAGSGRGNRGAGGQLGTIGVVTVGCVTGMYVDVKGEGRVEVVRSVVSGGGSKAGVVYTYIGRSIKVSLVSGTEVGRRLYLLSSIVTVGDTRRVLSQCIVIDHVASGSRAAHIGVAELYGGSGMDGVGVPKGTIVF